MPDAESELRILINCIYPDSTNKLSAFTEGDDQIGIIMSALRFVILTTLATSSHRLSGPSTPIDNNTMHQNLMFFQIYKRSLWSKKKECLRQ
ncbi:hypothetical protein STEG23_025312, partial [Scotinomys teguina]